MIILDRSFYERDPVTVAQELLGMVIVRTLRTGAIISGIIVETEAYAYGDPASHAFEKQTARNAALFGEPGHAYIYMIHTHYCFNAVAHDASLRAGGVLVRAVQPREGVEIMQKNRGIENMHALTNGPGKLANAMNITKELYGVDLTKKGPLYIINPTISEPLKMVTTKRIGISKAKDHPWRFYIAGNRWVSKGK